MFKKHFALWVVFIMGIGYSNAQTTDTLKFVKQKKVPVRKTIIGKEQHYQFKDSTGFVYKKPKLFSFITNLPKDAGGMVMAPFEKGTADIHAAIIGSTVGLIIADQPLIEGVGKLSEHIHLSDEGIYNDVFKIRCKNYSTSGQPEHGIVPVGARVPQSSFRRWTIHLWENKK